MPVLKVLKDGVWVDISGASGNTDADTLDGKHASDFASASDVTSLQTLVGDTSVSDQISNAVTAIEIPVSSVNGKTGAVQLSASDVGALPSTTIIPSIEGLASQTYVNEQVSGKVDKIDGMGLSENSFTTAEKEKLASINASTGEIIVDDALSTTSANPVQNKIVTERLNNISTLVGDTSVSEQISDAMSLTNLGITATAEELNILDGITATTNELNYLDGVTSNIQTQINKKASKDAATTTANGLMSASDKVKLDGITNGAGSIDTMIRKWRPVVDTGRSEWVLKTNNIRFTKSSFNDFSITSINGAASSAETEIFLGTVTFIDRQHGYMCQDIPSIDGVHFELRYGNSVYPITNGYIINEKSNTLWESVFKDKTFDLYVVIDEGSILNYESFDGLIYENTTLNDMNIMSFEDSADILYIEADTGGIFYEVTATSTTINGVTFTLNDDNTVTANGTATDDIEYIYGTQLLYHRKTTDDIYNMNTMFITCSGNKLDSLNGSHTFAFQTKDNSGNGLGDFYILRGLTTFQLNNIHNPLVTPNDSLASGEEVYIMLLIKKGSVLDNINFSYKSAYGVRKIQDVVKRHDSQLEEIEGLVGSTPVSEQINAALPDYSIVYGDTQPTNWAEGDIWLKPVSYTPPGYKIFYSDTQPTDWVEGDIWLKPVSQ